MKFVDIWDAKDKDSYDLFAPISKEVIEKAKNGIWDLPLGQGKILPKVWLPQFIISRKVLVIGEAGARCGYILSAIGADVTILDDKQQDSDKDNIIAEDEGFKIKTIYSDVDDLSIFDNKTFDFIIKFTAPTFPTCKEIYRILKQNCSLVINHSNRGCMMLKENLESINQNNFSEVTTEETLKCQISAGFLIDGFYEDGDDLFKEDFVPDFFATRATKR